jgi:hypothetical protein
MARLFPPEDQGLDKDLRMIRRARAKRNRRVPVCAQCKATYGVQFSLTAIMQSNAGRPLLCVTCEQAEESGQ